MPTGIALRDVREQLFAAAERVLRDHGPNALTSRAVTDEAGCAKGVLHRHFTDFDGFLAELVLRRIGRVDDQAEALRARVGEGSIADNLLDVLVDVFDPIALAAVALTITRDGMRTKLREAGVAGIPVLTESVAMITDYLTLERDHGRLPASVEPDLIALTMIGTAQLIFTAPDESVDERAALRRTVVAALPSGS
ncbi:TetR/AcrR family transcriptional regulator [Microlunatus sp. GCM10028923]|uniref:TetR/AcrR family transcriptional regulator n=1 Tax=Microlunatus sp. GCM10028923 TaxID=3273400 RepID=UPI0036083CE2